MSATSENPWPRRSAWAAVFLTVPLLLLGGTVTTLRVGMAVPDWPTTFGHNMFTYPLRDMLGNSGVFWEHSHRLYASFVGLCVIGVCVAHLVWERQRTARRLALFLLVFVIVQGIIGGARVLRNAPELAFLHGSLAQAFFGLAGALAVMHTQAWRGSQARACKRAAPLHRVSAGAVLIVYAQIVLGGWLRHSGHEVALAAHIVVAALATAVLVVLSRELRLTAEEGERGGHDRRALLVVRRHVVLALAAQLVLGVLAAVWVYIVTGPHNPVSIGEAIFATLHVAVGALLLWSVIAAAMLARRTVATTAGASLGAGALEGAR